MQEIKKKKKRKKERKRLPWLTMARAPAVPPPRARLVALVTISRGVRMPGAAVVVVMMVADEGEIAH